MLEYSLPEALLFMHIIPEALITSSYAYRSDKPLEELKAEIRQLLNDTKDWTNSVNLCGSFTAEFEFEMTPRWQFAIIRSFEQKISYLDGKLLPDENGKACVVFSVRPNSIFSIFFFVFPLLGVLALMNSNQPNKVEIATLFIGIFPGLMLLVGYFGKKGLKDTFVDYFSLREMEH